MTAAGTPATGPQRWWRSHSVRVRLTVWYVMAMVIVLGVYASAVYSFVSRNASEALNQQLRSDFVWVYAGLYQTVDGYMLNEPELIDPEAMLPWVQVWRGDRSVVVYRNSEALRVPLPEARLIVGEGITTLGTDGERMRILTERGDFRVERGALADARVVIQIARPEAPMRAQMRNLAVLLILGLPLAVLAAGVGGYILARRALAPIERMTEHAQTITAERLSDRLPVVHPEDEMGRLAAVFNETLARLERSFEQMRRFTADVSHQLRTPLTAIRSVGEVGLRAGHRDESAYRAIIASMLEETDRLAVLVNRLLTLSRAEMRQSMSRDRVDLLDLAEDVAGHLAVLAEEKGQTLSIDGTGKPAAIGDRVVLRQALVNLVDNAIKFTPAGGEVHIQVAELNGRVVVDVIDSGPGIPDEVKPRIFDRFYRGDKVAESGTGLGLSIAKGAVEANGGDLTLDQSGPGGTRFRISLPRPPRA